MDDNSEWSVEFRQDVEMATIVESERSVGSGRSVESGPIARSGRNEESSQGCGWSCERGLHVFWVTCVLIGCFYAFLTNCLAFSKFEVTTRVVIDDVKYHDVYLHLCAPIEQVFDEAGYNNKTGSKLKLDRSSKNESIKSGQKLIYNVTTKNLLEFTPKVKEIFESCQLRQKTNDYEGMETFNGTQCNGWFDVIKYLSNTDCCLKLSLPPWIGSLDDTDVAFDPFAVGIVRSITLNHTLVEKVTSFKAFYTLGESLGYQELKTAPTIDRGYDYKNRSTFYNHFGIRYHVVTEKNVMTWPHRTCSEKLSKEEELAMCLSKGSKDNFEKYSPMALIKHGDDRKILSKLDLHGKWKKKAWKEVVTKCHEMTDHIKECKDVRVVTTVDERLAVQDTNLTLAELVKADASFEYIHEPKIDIESLLLTMGAILSTGFGFSLYTWRGCRWKRHKKDGKCCFFGFKSKIEDSEAKRVTKLENGRRADRKLIDRLTEDNVKLNAEVQKIRQTLVCFMDTVDPIRTDMKKLETGLQKSMTDVYKLKKNRTVDRHDLDAILDQLPRRRH